MSERGSVVLPAVAMAGVLLLLGAALGVCGAIVVRHRVAQAAADLGALAAATAAQRGMDPCGAAVSVVELDQARLDACVVVAETVTLAVSVEGPGWLVGPSRLTARARAGPAP